jgi:tRNA dimethylallyltransferase
MKPKIIFLVGPTAIGKTEIATILARKINAEIISCDSMQLYKGMDIITSKPSFALRKKIPHHLVNIVSPIKEYNVFRYRKAALEKIREISKKGKTPLFVGGTGLYMSIVIDGIFKSKAANKKMRSFLYKQAQIYGSEYLYKKLERQDPEAALKIHPHDTKRIVRALEVLEITGRPISYLQKQRRGLSDKYDIKIFGLNMDKEMLYKKIQQRVNKMFNLGLISEVKGLLRMRLSKTAAYAIGIKELKGYLGGVYDLDEAKRQMIRNTCQYAKRQMTWFRKDKRINWINLSDKERSREIVGRIWKELYW